MVSPVQFKFMLRLLAENIFQLHLQLTTLGLTMALVGFDSAAQLMLLSALFSGASLVQKLLQYSSTILDIFHQLEKPIHLKVILFLATVATVVLVSYAALKFAALGWCAQYLLNVTGCVVLDV
mmetsp:Transcript_59722/g.128681  ORF Transcript_59722/g.128681 Transcript_59722/m.128681 type:complete len:123 (+) Transcript_59722:3-371(+)